MSNFSNFSAHVRDALAVRPDRLRLGAEVALGLILAVQAGRLIWLFAGDPAGTPAPAPVPGRSSAVDYSVFQRFDAFFRTGGQGSLAEATAAGSQQLRLYGIRSDGDGGGSAIIGLADGRQVSVAVGETVEPGLVLQAVEADHVVLARGASLSRLIFSDVPLGVAEPPAPPATPQTVAPVPPVAAPAAADLAAEAGLRPRMKGLGVDGFTVTGPAGGPLKEAGLRTGDVVVAVNGRRLNAPARIAALRDQLAGGGDVELLIERDGSEQTLNLRTGR